MLVNIHHKVPYDVYIGRPKAGEAWGFGNPFVVGVHAPRGRAIDMFERWLLTGDSQGSIHATSERRIWIMKNIHSLKGKTLGCFCTPNPCHGEVLLKLIGHEFSVSEEPKKVEVTMIDSFRGKYSFLSNFHSLQFAYTIPVRVGDVILHAPTSEHAFMACKSLNPTVRKAVLLAKTPGEAKKMGKQVPLRDDWEDIKVEVMASVLRAKFRDPDLRQRLLSTGNTPLVEGNQWHDNFWGACTCERCAQIEHHNTLGKLLMDLRSTL